MLKCWGVFIFVLLALEASFQTQKMRREKYILWSEQICDQIKQEWHQITKKKCIFFAICKFAIYLKLLLFKK